MARCATIQIHYVCVPMSESNSFLQPRLALLENYTHLHPMAKVHRLDYEIDSGLNPGKYEPETDDGDIDPWVIES